MMVIRWKGVLRRDVSHSFPTELQGEEKEAGVSRDKGGCQLWTRGGGKPSMSRTSVHADSKNK